MCNKETNQEGGRCGRGACQEQAPCQTWVPPLLFVIFFLIFVARRRRMQASKIAISVFRPVLYNKQFLLNSGVEGGSPRGL